MTRSLMQGPGQVQGLRFDRPASVLDLLQVGHVRVTMFSPAPEARPCFPDPPDSVNDVVGHGSVQLVQGSRRAWSRTRSVPEQVKNLGRSVSLPIRPG